MTPTDQPPAPGVPKELLLEDFKQQCTNLQGQYTRMHNRLQLLVGLNTALLPTLGAVALAASKGDVGRSWILLFPGAGLFLSAIGYITGATDRKLVTIYRRQLQWTAKYMLAEYSSGNGDYDKWVHTGLDPGEVEEKLDLQLTTQRERPPLWDRATSWRRAPLSATRLPAVLSLALAVIWLILLALLSLDF